MALRQIKCEHCGLWTNGEQQTCLHCGEITDAKYKSEISERHKTNPFEFRFVKIKDFDPWWVKSYKFLIYIAQIIFFMVVSIIVYLSSVFTH